MKFVLDSYAWLEYFMGTSAGEKARVIIDAAAHERLTPAIALAETYAKVLRIEGSDAAEARRSFITLRSAIVPLDEHLAVEAARVDVERKRVASGWGLADSVILATARLHGGKALTGDVHFRGLAQAELL